MDGKLPQKNLLKISNYGKKYKNSIQKIPLITDWNTKCVKN